MRIMAIDPGDTGAITIFDDGKLIIKKIPETPRAIWELLKESNVEKVYIEKVGQHMEGNSASSSVKLGKSYGILIGLLTAMEIRYIDISPNMWMKKLNTSLPAGRANYSKRKTAIWNYVQNFFPKEKIYKYQADSVALMIVMEKLDK